MYTMTWRNKWLTAEAKSIDDMIATYAATLKLFEEMRDDGVVLLEGGMEDDYATLATKHRKVAKKYEFNEEDVP